MVDGLVRFLEQRGKIAGDRGAARSRRCERCTTNNRQFEAFRGCIREREQNRCRREGVGFLNHADPMKSSGGFLEHRRAISPRWRCLRLRIRRGSREERWGFVEGADAGLRTCGRKWGEVGLRFRFPEKEGGSWRR
jgi:hypothetical protein